MTLYDKICVIYPELLGSNYFEDGTIILQNDGHGDYIKVWKYTKPKPTEEQLNSTN